MTLTTYGKQCSLIMSGGASSSALYRRLLSASSGLLAALGSPAVAKWNLIEHRMTRHSNEQRLHAEQSSRSGGGPNDDGGPHSAFCREPEPSFALAEQRTFTRLFTLCTLPLPLTLALILTLTVTLTLIVTPTLALTPRSDPHPGMQAHLRAPAVGRGWLAVAACAAPPRAPGKPPASPPA